MNVGCVVRGNGKRVVEMVWGDWRWRKGRVENSKPNEEEWGGCGMRDEE